jgi:hypothetical protein
MNNSNKLVIIILSLLIVFSFIGCEDDIQINDSTQKEVNRNANNNEQSTSEIDFHEKEMYKNDKTTGIQDDDVQFSSDWTHEKTDNTQLIFYKVYTEYYLVGRIHEGKFDPNIEDFINELSDKFIEIDVANQFEDESSDKYSFISGKLDFDLYGQCYLRIEGNDRKENIGLSNNTLPRVVMRKSRDVDEGKLRDIAEEVLEKKGICDVDIRIDDMVEVDFDSDGKNEIIYKASNCFEPSSGYPIERGLLDELLQDQYTAYALRIINSALALQE